MGHAGCGLKPYGRMGEMPHSASLVDSLYTTLAVLVSFRRQRLRKIFVEVGLVGMGPAGASGQADSARMKFPGALFKFQVGPVAAGELVEVHLVGVELRTLDTGEADLTADGDAASSTHPRAVDHDGLSWRRS